MGEIALSSLLGPDSPLAGGFRCSTAGMADFGISPGQSVAVVWDKPSPLEALKDLVEKLQALTGSEGRVSVENVNQLLQCKYLPRLSLQGRVGGGGELPRECCISDKITDFLFGWHMMAVACHPAVFS